ncbi:MAG TPA: hypothetical protein VF796_00430 [Humisphaera sp.]
MPAPLTVLPVETIECPPFAVAPSRRRRGRLVAGCVLALAAAGVGVFLLVQQRGPVVAAAADGDGYASASPPVSPRDRSGVLQDLTVLASAIDLYAVEHNGALPDLSSGWGQLVDYTTSEGATSPAKTGNAIYGPYLRRPLVNRLNGSAKVAPVDVLPDPGDPVPATAAHAGAGWLIERKSGQVAATDGYGGRVFDPADVRQGAAGTGWQVLVPGLAEASSDARRSNVQTTVQTLRSQIALYKLQHNDQLPDLVRYPRWQQFTGKTDAAGNLRPAAGVQTFGPYLQEVPVNSLNGCWAVQVLPGAPPVGFRPNYGVGFVFDSETGRLWGADGQGRLVP